jgi:DNA (cytosine-5)-methyltransferase 1
MIKLATVFSGIGAPEEALKQLNKEFETVFACDNGERELELTYDEIIEQTKEMTYEQRLAFVNDLYKKTGKENYVKKSYMANYDLDEEHWYEDVRFLDGAQYADQVDLFVGGSPCQSFSTYGLKRGLEDARGTLFYDYARLVDQIKPKVFIYENVTGCLTHDRKRTWKVMESVWRSLGYELAYDVLNATDYNHPQLRKRLFLVGFRKDIYGTPYSFPTPKKLTKKSTEFLETDPVDDIYYLGKKGFEWVTNPSRNLRRSRVNQDIIGCQTANQQDNWIGDFRVERPKPHHYADKRIYVGKYKIDGVTEEDAVARKMTPSECLRLMGFSDNFKIVVSDTSMYQQAGNSIVVDVLIHIMEQILKSYPELDS